MPADVSLATVAARAGVSVSTVSRIVNGETGRASEATVERVRKAIEEVGYRPNPVGRALRRGESQTVAMLAANLDNPAMATIAASTETALREAGYVMILCDTYDQPDLQDEYLLAMRAQLVRGIVVVAAVQSPGLVQATRDRTPIVYVARPSPLGPASFVGIDDHAAGLRVAEHALARGLRRPAVLQPARGSVASRARAAGIVEGLKRGGLAEAAIRIVTGEGLKHMNIGYDGAAGLFQGPDRPDGVLCISDQIAYGAYRRALEAGLRVPEDCAFVSIDGTALSQWVAPWLTSVRIPFEDYGAAVVASFEELWAGEPMSTRILPFTFA